MGSSWCWYKIVPSGGKWLITSHSSRTNNSWLFAPSSLILANYYLPLNGALGDKESYA